jgi:hypothetical protein
MLVPPSLVLVLTLLGLVLRGGVTLTDTLLLALPPSLLLLSIPKSEEAMGAMLSNAPLLGLLSLALPVPVPPMLLLGVDAAVAAVPPVFCAVGAALPSCPHVPCAVVSTLRLCPVQALLL